MPRKRTARSLGMLPPIRADRGNSKDLVAQVGALSSMGGGWLPRMARWLLEHTQYSQAPRLLYIGGLCLIPRSG